MKTDATALVAHAESVEVVGKIAKEISAQASAAVIFRQRANMAGLEIGRVIIGACFDAEVRQSVIKDNLTEKKRLEGGAACKAYNWLAKRVAEKTRYSAEYLEKCARNYLNALNRHRTAARKEPLATHPKEGVFPIVNVNPLPAVAALEKYLKPVVEPALDDLDPDVETQPETQDAAQGTTPRVDVEEFIADVATALRKKLHQPGINLRTNKVARTKLRQAANEVLADQHFALKDLLTKGD